MSSNTIIAAAVILASSPLISSAMWLPTDLHARQADITTASTRTWPNSTQTTGSGSADASFPVAAIIIPVALCACLFIGLVFWSWRKKMRQGLPASSSSSRHVRTGSTASSSNGNDGFQTIRAGDSSSQDNMSSTSRASRAAQRLWHGFIWAFHVDRPNSHLVHQEAQQDGSAAQRRDSRARRRSRRRRDRHNNVQLRRTESGRSILTVPEYKSEVADGEVMLYKAMDDSAVGSTEAFDVTASPDDSSHQDTALHRTVSQSIAAGLRNSFRRSMNRRPASRASRASSHRSNTGGDGDEDPARTRPVELRTMDEVTEVESRPSVAIVVPEDDTPDYDALFPVESRGADSEATTTRGGLGRFFRTHRASRSSPNAATVLPLTTTTTSSFPATRQHRRFNSSASVFSTLAGGTSCDDLRPDSTPNVNGRPISHPLRSTLVHMTSSHRINEEQMRFLGSVESLGRYGLPFDGSSTRGSFDVASMRGGHPQGVAEPPRYDYPARPPPLLLASEAGQGSERHEGAQQHGSTTATTHTDNTDSSSFQSAGS